VNKLRIKLQARKQKELLLEFKKRHCFTWNQLSAFLGVKSGSLKEWYLENCLIPSEVYKSLNPHGEYDEFIVKILPDNWGKQKGGFCSAGNVKSIKIPKYSENLAEFIGIMLGDGNLHFLKNQSYMVRIAGHSIFDREYLTKHVYSLCIELFGVTPKFYQAKDKNEMVLLIHSKKIVGYLLKIGLKSGDKIRNKSDIPSWIMKHPSFLSACLRGLIDTDGSIYRMSKKDSNLLRIGFTNHNLTLLSQCQLAFTNLGFHPSKIVCKHSFFISRKSDITAWLQVFRKK
jgi:intein/homing endonuclease